MLPHRSSKIRLWPFDTSLQSQKNSLKLLVVPVVLAAIHTLRSRGIAALLHIALPIASTLAALVVLGLVLLYKASIRDDRRFGMKTDTRRLRLMTLIIALVAIPALCILYCVATTTLGDLLTWVTTLGTEYYYHPTRVRIVMALLCLSSGAAFYAFRRSLRVCYGMTEIIAAVLVGLIRTSEANLDVSREIVKHLTKSFAIGVFTASVYLVVRGLDNIFEGLKNKSDPIAEAALTWLRRQRYIH